MKIVSKKWLLFLPVLMVVVALRPLVRRQPPAMTSPNIVFLLADDQRWDALGIAGNPVIKTPNIDQLARDGFYFRRAYVTTPICCISRASILSGQYARRHGIVDFATPFSDAALAQTYPMLLRKAGYRTGFIGKYGVGEEMPSAQFDYWRGFKGQGNYAAQDANGQPIHLTDLMSQQIREFIGSDSDRRPFCLSVSFKAPHAQDAANPEFPYANRFAALYTDTKLNRPTAAQDKFYRQFPDWFRHNDQNESRIRWRRRFATDSMFQETTKSYFRLINGIDEVVANLRAQLKQQGLADNTIIIYTSDNGFYVGEYGFADKWYGHEQSIRVPLILYDPRHPSRQGRSSDKYALNIDLAPTILTLAGVRVPGSMQGRSLTELMDNAKEPWRTSFFFEHLINLPTVFIPQSEGVMKADRKYVHYFNLQHAGDGYDEVYDLHTDPLELDNLASQSRGQQLKKSLVPLFERLKKMAE